MIKQIKKIVIENKNSFTLPDFSVSEVNVSKFFHGNPAVNTKVLFFVSVSDTPLCIIKISRSPEDNVLIKKEVEGLNYFHKNKLLVPRIFFHGELNGLAYVCEEILNGVPLGKRDELAFLPELISYHSAIKKGKKITIGSILSIFNNINSSYKEFTETRALLKERSTDYVWLAAQHGDITYKNLITVKGKIYFIDFENFNMRPIWGLDLIHYLTRLTDAYSKDRDVSDTLNRFTKLVNTKGYHINLTQRELENLFLLELFFEILQKNFFERRSEILPLMEKIWSL